jgi:hypothetical protein
LSKSEDLMKAIAARGIGERYLVTRIARQHAGKRANKRKVNLPSYRDGVSPKLLLLLLLLLFGFSVFEFKSPPLFFLDSV